MRVRLSRPGSWLAWRLRHWTWTPGNAVKRYADADQQSMNSWIEGLLDVEDMRWRCAAHERWMAAHPEAVVFAQTWADRNLDELAGR